jgi:hypothetical protein
VTWKQSGPSVGLQPTAALRDSWQGESYPPTDRPQAIHDLAEVFAARILEAERSLLSAGLWDPPGLHRVACEHGLAGCHFALSEHSYVFAYLCLSVENGHIPSDPEALELAKVAGVALDAPDLRYIVATDHDPRLWSEYVQTVVANAHDFTRARTALREAVGVLMGTIGFDFDIIIRPCVRPRRRVVG